jgi:hypothetical protein
VFVLEDLSRNAPWHGHWDGLGRAVGKACAVEIVVVADALDAAVVYVNCLQRASDAAATANSDSLSGIRVIIIHYPDFSIALVAEG